jgi:putative MATE family efflux protein
MKDLTQGSLVRHILVMAGPIAIGMIFQTLYYLIDLYFVAQLGDTAIAGVSSAGNATFIIFGLTQVLGVGTGALISHAVGRKDQPEANLIFNQSLLLSVLFGAVTLLAGFLLTGAYMHAVAADEPTAAAGKLYLYWFTPGLALQFALVAMMSALRGTGIVRPTMMVQMVSVLLNAVLAPMLIAGWGTGRPMGVAGAGLASTLAIAIAVVMLSAYFIKLEMYVAFDRALLRPRLQAWRRMLAIGLPAGGELLLLFVYVAIIYWCIRDFGAVAQAGFGIGSRVMQSIFLPAMAIAFAAGPIAGQNFGALQGQRVRETFNHTIVLITCIMAVLTLLVQVRPELLVGGFTEEPAVLQMAATFLRITSLNFIAQGMIFTCSSLFQGLGDTRPAVISTATRLVTFGVPAAWLSAQSSFQIHHLWYLSVATCTLQAVVSFLLLRLQFRARLPVAVAGVPASLTS